jgi:hypothetical protein
MNTLRITRSTYVAAFLLGALIALLVLLPAHAASSGPLDRIAIVRFSAEGDGSLRQQQGLLHDDGRFLPRGSSVVPRPENAPAWVFGRNLIPVEAWHAYYALGYNALSRFELHDGGARVRVGDREFLLVAPSFEVPLTDGRIANVSTRGRLLAPNDVAIVGFVVEDRPRVVLIRAIGPTLQKFGIGSYIPDPFLSVKRGNGQTLYFNDNWNAAAEADAIRAATVRVGAFALDEGSRDAARLVELAPGAYSIHAESATGAGAGEVLIEVYSVPGDVDLAALDN